MKRFISAIIAIYLLSEPLLFAQVFLPHRRKAFSTGITYLLQQDFEGSGYDNPSYGSWTETGSGTINEDSTTSPLVGAQSMRIGGGSQIAWTASPSFTPQTTVHAFFRFRTSGNPASTRRFFFIRDNSATDVCLIALNADGTVLVRAGTAGGNNTAGALSPSTDYRMWVRYTAGGGGNAEAAIYISTDDTKPGSETMIHQTGNATTDATHIGLGITTAVSVPTWDFDKIRVSASVIGSNPT